MNSNVTFTLILGAMDCEIETMKQEVNELEEVKWNSTTFFKGHINQHPVILAKSGVGKVFSAMTTQYFISRYRVHQVFFTGIAGGLRADLEIGDILVGTDAIQHDMDATKLGFERGEIPYTSMKLLESDAMLVSKALTLPLTAPRPLKKGRVLTGDQFLAGCSPEQLTFFTETLGGAVIEMEGASVATVCAFNNIPFLIIRTVSDKANQSAQFDFESFLPRASHNSRAMVMHLLA